MTRITIYLSYYYFKKLKVELYGKKRNSSSSELSKETSSPISKSQIRKFISNIYIEEIYSLNAKIVFYLVDPESKIRINYSQLYEKELE